MTGFLKRIVPLGCITLIAGAVSGNLALPVPHQPKLRAETIDESIEIGYGLAVADVDGDGRKDILLVDKQEVVWYENPTWKKHRMTGKLTERDHVCIAARDIDNDGMADVAVGAGWNPGDTQNSGAIFYLIPPEDRRREWEPVRLPHEPTVHRMHWVRGRDDNFFLAVLPLHGRGNRNGAGEGIRFVGYERPKEPRGVWRTFELDDSFHKAHNFELARWDSDDNAEEMLVASAEGISVMENDKDVGWESKQIIPEAAGEVRSGRLYSGRRFIVSIEPMHGNKVVVNTHKTTFTGQVLWTENRVVIDEDLIQGHALATGDMLGTGYHQIIAGWRGNGRPGDSVGIKMYVSTHKRGYTWQEHALIDDGNMACEDLKLADLNGDGKLDLIACGRATKNVIIYWNETHDPSESRD